METEAGKFRTFEDLEAYKAARGFRVTMYAVSRRLPDFEKFELASQIRRAAVSLTNNIAEGHGRWHFLDQIKFVLQARGSLEELLDDVNVCEDEKYLPSAEIAQMKHSLACAKAYQRLSALLRDRKKQSSALHENSVPYGDTDPRTGSLAGLPPLVTHATMQLM